MGRFHFLYWEASAGPAPYVPFSAYRRRIFGTNVQAAL
jgi:hypothetical protein